MPGKEEVVFCVVEKVVNRKSDAIGIKGDLMKIYSQMRQTDKK